MRPPGKLIETLALPVRLRWLAVEQDAVRATAGGVVMVYGSADRLATGPSDGYFCPFRTEALKPSAAFHQNRPST
jgi:hypothetical protein